MERGLGASAWLEQGARTQEVVDWPCCVFPSCQDHGVSTTQGQRPPRPLWSVCLHRRFQDPEPTARRMLRTHWLWA